MNNCAGGNVKGKGDSDDVERQSNNLVTTNYLSQTDGFPLSVESMGELT